MPTLLLTEFEERLDMTFKAQLGKGLMACVFMTTLISLTSCTDDKKNPTAKLPESAQSAPASTSAEVEKQKPKPGTGNVQGKVLFNSKPVASIEVKLCEKFSRFIGGCSGKTYIAKTDKSGEYVIANVKPQVYEALLSRVFDTDSYVFATTGIGGLSSSKYEVTADKTLFASPTNLFKSDLKILNPKAGSKVSAQNLELKWAAYPDAAYYKFSIYAEDTKVTTSQYINERVEGTSFAIDKPLEKRTYRWQVNAYNSDDHKLAESDGDIKFTIK
ncbi:MAG: hypothetical protein ACAF41_21840 [Leptolyngbya sp. BL-A-14]